MTTGRANSEAAPRLAGCSESARRSAAGARCGWTCESTKTRLQVCSSSSRGFRCSGRAGSGSLSQWGAVASISLPNVISTSSFLSSWLQTRNYRAHSQSVSVWFRLGSKTRASWLQHNRRSRLVCAMPHSRRSCCKPRQSKSEFSKIASHESTISWLLHHSRSPLKRKLQVRLGLWKLGRSLCPMSKPSGLPDQ